MHPLALPTSVYLRHVSMYPLKACGFAAANLCSLIKIYELSAYLKTHFIRAVRFEEESAHRKLYLCGAYVGKIHRILRAREKRWDIREKKYMYSHITLLQCVVRFFCLCRPIRSKEI